MTIFAASGTSLAAPKKSSVRRGTGQSCRLLVGSVVLTTPPQARRRFSSRLARSPRLSSSCLTGFRPSVSGSVTEVGAFVPRHCRQCTMTVPERSLRRRSALASLSRAWLKRLSVRAEMASRRIRGSRLGKLPWPRVVVGVLAGTTIIAATLMTGVIGYIFFDRNDLPDLEAFTRFEFPTIGHIYDANGQPLMEMAASTARSPGTTTSRRLFVTRSSPRRTRTSSPIPELTTPDLSACWASSGSGI